MDKDMERLGKERLKRVKRRRQLATFVVSMAVIVLSKVYTGIYYEHKHEKELLEQHPERE